MLNKQRVANYLTQLQKISRQEFASYLSFLKHFENQNKVLVTFHHIPRMMSPNQPSAVKADLSEVDGEVLLVKYSQSTPGKLSKRQKKKMKKMKKQKDEELIVYQGEAGSTPKMEIDQALRGEPFSSVDNLVGANSHADKDLVISENINRKENKILSAISSTSKNNISKDGMTSNQAFLSAFTLSSSQAVECTSSPPKLTKKGSHKRGFHSETTPSKSRLPKMNCSEYWPLERVEEGIMAGKVVTGNFRINQRAYTNAYITGRNGERDILIEGIDRRNRAMHGDVVAVELIIDDDPIRKEVADIARKLAEEFGTMQLIEEKLKKDDQQRGRVVRILEKKHSRKGAGVLKPFQNNSFGFALFSPQDSRLPRIMISLIECPQDFISRPQDFQHVLFIAEITHWKATCAMASGKLLKQLGESGEIEPETEGFLMEYNIDDGPFPEEALSCLPPDLPWKIPEDEFSKRKDLRSECIFTIDPSTARDLDDALSVKLKEDGNFQVGVHIADVSYFIEEGCALDDVASRRATSVYLVQRVVPMLPRLLCERLCSLNPGDDKLTYSVMWTITPDGKVLDEWFGRTVIRSCAKLSYDHAQHLITAADLDMLDLTQLPEVEGPHETVDIHQSVRRLYELSLILRKKRFDSGALNLNQPKLVFTLDADTKQPNGFGSYVAKDSNRLVEEFMLLANMAVAHRLVQSLPEHAILRRHPAPHPKMIEDLLALCKRCGVAIDAATSHQLHNSLQKLKELDSSQKEAVYYGLVSLCSKPMQLAKYFCAGALEDEKLYHHYALNVPLYTHFTSPIRRYPDIMVHRMLTAALEKGGSVAKSVPQLQKLAEECNDRKASAKKVQELSSELFFGVYIRQLGELREQAVIIGLLDSSIDVLLLHSGLVKRVYCNSLPLHQWKVDKEQKDMMTVYWKEEEESVMNGNEATSNGTEVKSKGAVGNASKESRETNSPRLHDTPKESKGTKVSKSRKAPKGTRVSNSAECSKSDGSSDAMLNAQPCKSDDHEPVGQKQIFHMFDRIDVILKADEDKGSHKIKVLIPMPDKD